MGKRRLILHKADRIRLMRKCILGFLAVIAAIWLVLFPVNQIRFSIQLAGESDVYLEYGEEYEESGASVMVHGRYFWKEGVKIPYLEVEISSELQENRLGRYRISYASEIIGQTLSAERKVYVIDTVCPVITFHTDSSLPGGKPSKYSFSATDNYDGDITDKVICTKTTGWMTYSVMDSSGNPTYVVREISEYAAQPPEIHLEGGEALAITVGSFYTEPGYEAMDEFDGDLTKNVQVEGEVNWLVPGKYPITYTVTDSYDNVVTVVREVVVEAKTRPETKWPENKTIYLTFDDGPGPYTGQLLDILEKHHVKATFFVTDSGYDGIMQEIVSSGHSIGIHTVSHDYSEIYASPEAYFQDLWQMREIIYENTGVYTSLVRFPGGSSNLVSMDSCEGIMTVLSEAVQDAGFQYFDWNVDSDDAGSANQAEEVFRNVTEGIGSQGTAVVLMHDINRYTVDAVEDIILWGMENGYSFMALRDNSPGFHHDIRN